MKKKRQKSWLKEWLDSPHPVSGCGGLSAKEVFARVGIKNVRQLSQFLKDPNVDTFLKVASLEDGQSAHLQLDGKEVVVMRIYGRIRVMDSSDYEETAKRLNAAFARVVPEFASEDAFRSWVNSLPKWGS